MCPSSAARDYEHAEAALTEALAPFGGLDWARPGMKVALKVNLVSGGKPDSAVVPHPKFVSALCRLLVARGAEVVVGDSPGGLYTAPFVGHVYSASGMTAVEEAGARLNRDFSQRAGLVPRGQRYCVPSSTRRGWTARMRSSTSAN